MARSVCMRAVQVLFVIGAVAIFSRYAGAETPVEHSSEARFQLDLHVPDAVLNSFLPLGWTPNIATQGAAKDANLRAGLHRSRDDQRARWKAGRKGIEPARVPRGAGEGPGGRECPTRHRRPDGRSGRRARAVRNLSAGHHPHDAALHRQRDRPDHRFAGLGVSACYRASGWKCTSSTSTASPTKATLPRSKFYSAKHPSFLSDLAAGTGAGHPAQRDDESSRSREGVLVQSRRRELREAVRRHGKTAELGQHSLDQPLDFSAVGRILPARPSRFRRTFSVAAKG